jgi:Holliday junction resolvasome RuvABC endonuclease subunit
MRITIESINDFLEKYNWKCISDTYQNLDQELEFICDEGHTVYAPYRKIRETPSCPICKLNAFKQEKFDIIRKGKEKRVLAFDQATHVSGWSVFDGDRLIAYGVFKAEESKNVATRILEVRNWVLNMVYNWQPDLVGIEDIQFQQYGGGVLTFKTLAHLQGVLINAFTERNIKHVVCSVSTWRNKCGVTGKSKSDRKRSMQLKVKDRFDVTVTDDEADAIGIGYYLTGRV